jgi:N6-adenosine-specific RNA methylase IME4
VTVYSDFADIPRGKYGAILADPPWNHDAWERGGDRHPSRHYDVMNVAAIAQWPVPLLAASHCALFCWACLPLMHAALQLIEEWGFDYRTTAFMWVKTNPVAGSLAWGCGAWTRANPEPCLLATRGAPKRRNADVHSVIVAPRREHSRKPDEVYARIEALVDGPYLELFARQERPGWDSFGNEVGKFAPEPRQEAMTL